MVGNCRITSGGVVVCVQSLFVSCIDNVIGQSKQSMNQAGSTYSEGIDPANVHRSVGIPLMKTRSKKIPRSTPVLASKYPVGRIFKAAV